MSRLIKPLLLALGLTQVACAPMPPQPSPPYAGQCDDAKLGWAVGKQATADVVERVRVESGSQSARVLKPGQMVTLEFIAGRVNVYVDAANRIERVACG